MSANDKIIRIIKREEVERSKDSSNLSRKTERQIRREMLKRVTSWVDEKKENKRFP